MDKNKVLVFDLECACWRGHPPEGMRHDIIEIGYCFLDVNDGSISNRTGMLIKPENSVISPFCEEITGITQKMVDTDGISFRDAIAIMMDKHSTQAMCSIAWGKSDTKFMRSDCVFYGTPYPLGKTHLNAQKLFKKHNRMKNDMSVANALAHIGKQFEGQQHRALDDAYNAAIIYGSIVSGTLVKGHGPQ